MTIAESLKKFRKAFNLRQVDVAKSLGITQQAYAVYESGVEPGAKTLIKIADVYNVTTDYLLGRSDNPNGVNIDSDIIQAVSKFNAELQQIINRDNQ